MSAILDRQRLTRELHPGRQPSAFTELMREVYGLSDRQISHARLYSAQLERCPTIEAVRLIVGKPTKKARKDAQ